MRRIILAAAAVVLVGGPALAQTTTTTRHPAQARTHRASGGRQTPLDVGPNTPEANRAYQGGGVVLQGAPGGPAPTPEPTPPGQAPRGSVSPVR